MFTHHQWIVGFRPYESGRSGRVRYFYVVEGANSDEALRTAWAMADSDIERSKRREIDLDVNWSEVQQIVEDLLGGRTLVAPCSSQGNRVTADKPGMLLLSAR
ncbi:hypothetical protein ABZ733_36570 [Streptomyces longwoodensis]|uniref:hypothetical protein n=1 Tax=Streptomyces longwoodensis TaxID=68231 RepID=UPI0033C639A9